jgi:hypothetical protein
MHLCPECGSLLQPVSVKTVKHLLKYPLARSLAPGALGYCSDRGCDIYYLRFEEGSAEPAEVFRAADIKERATPLAQGDGRLVCYCFGYTEAEIRQDARATGAIPASISAEIKAGNCACEVMNPSGH